MQAYERRWEAPPKVEFALDSPLEGAGFELSVPRDRDGGFHSSSRPGPFPKRTDGPNVSRSAQNLPCPRGLSRRKLHRSRGETRPLRRLAGLA
jgi:hypothetical protein